MVEWNGMAGVNWNGEGKGYVLLICTSVKSTSMICTVRSVDLHTSLPVNNELTSETEGESA